MPASSTSAKPLRYLALGDSYTIGEQVAPADNFPNQFVRLARQAGMDMADARIIARTGWTTDELQAAIDAEDIKPPYDVVTLLIGVNNQYRGRDTVNYREEFESLLKQAIVFAGSDPSRVIVLSIPDWGVTPFAHDRDAIRIANEINAYNMVNKSISGQYKVKYIDITPSTRRAGMDRTLLAGDGLHPSGKEYAVWAAMAWEEAKGLVN